MADAKKLEAIEARLRELALAYPGAHEEFPWGERVVKVRGKILAAKKPVAKAARKPAAKATKPPAAKKARRSE